MASMLDAQRRLSIAVELSRTGLELQRQSLRRRWPDANEDRIDRLFEAWLLDRPLDYEPG